MANVLNWLIPIALFALAVWVVIRGIRKRRAGGCSGCPYSRDCGRDKER